MYLRQAGDPGRLLGEVVGQGAEPQPQAGPLRRLGQQVGGGGGRGPVVGAVHRQHRGRRFGVVRAPGAEPLGQLGGAAGHQGRVVHQAGGVAVPAVQVFGPDRGAVRGGPGEGGAAYPFRHTPPDAGVRQSGTGQDLRHLGDVPEHVGQVADRHGRAEPGGAAQPQLQVADDVLARAEELVEQDLPRADGQPAGRDQGGDPVPPLGAYLQVVVDGGELAVQGEPLARIALHPFEHLVEECHQAEPEALERLVPLAVPVGVRHHHDARRYAHCGTSTLVRRHPVAASPPTAVPVSSPNRRTTC
ncbi:hypothetical protein GCM10027615_56320 [Plantactinospora veratri]